MIVEKRNLEQDDIDDAQNEEKVFKTNDELIRIISEKGVIISDRKLTEELIRKYTYYSIINTYKSIFKKEDKYIVGVTFDEIYALFDFDKKLRFIILNSCLEIELVIKSYIANRISEEYGIKDYLKIENLNETMDEEKKKSLLDKINKEIADVKGTHSAVSHYIDEYGYVPPFVLTKILSFGDISKLYGALKQKDRQAISSCYKISDNLLKQIIIVIALVRNIAAHNDRLYDFRSKKYIKFSKIEKDYVNKAKDLVNLYMVIKCMKRIMNEEKYNYLYESFVSLVKEYKDKFKSIKIEAILDIIGFDEKSIEEIICQ